MRYYHSNIYPAAQQFKEHGDSKQRKAGSNTKVVAQSGYGGDSGGGEQVGVDKGGKRAGNIRGRPNRYRGDRKQ